MSFSDILCFSHFWVGSAPKSVRKEEDRLKSVSILPVHKGEMFLENKLKSILELNYPAEKMEILVLSDVSEDRTDSIAEAFASRGVRLVRLPRGSKAQALNRGLTEAKNEILVLTDVRQPLERDSPQRLIACFADPSGGVVSGDLTIREGERLEANIGLYRRYESWTRAQLEPSARCFDYPTALDSDFRRKVRTQAGVYKLIRYFPQLILPWTGTGFHFLSLKLGRLLLPFALLGLFISSFGLPTPWNYAALLAQAAFYCIAFIDLFLPETAKLKRLSSPFRSFLVLVASTLWAVSILLAWACGPRNLHEKLHDGPGGSRRWPASSGQPGVGGWGFSTLFVSPRALWKETKVSHLRSAA